MPEETDAISLTPTQQEIVAMDVARLAILAVAGSGKTRVLVARYLRHVVEEGLSPSQILTLTFTVKAAAEMRGRIVTRLLQEGRVREAREAETGPISTIDAWVQDFLRTNALAAGLDPEFTVLDGARSSQYLAYSFREALAETLQQDEDVQRLVGMMADQQDRDNREPYTFLQSQVASWIGAMRSSLYSREELERINATPQGQLAKFEELVLGDLPADVQKAFAETEGDFSERVRQAWKDAGRRGRPGWLNSASDVDHEAQLAPSAALARLSLATWERLDQRLWMEQSFDFAAQTRLALQLLESTPEVRARVQATYPVIMVDEAQDVSPIQHRLLQAIGAHRMVWIGDHQQSIYGFRDADVDLFLETVSQCQRAEMGENKRSQPNIQAFIDQAAGNWWAPTTPYKALRPDALDLESTRRPYWPEAEIWDMASSDTAAIAKLIAGLNPTKWEDVAVLTLENAAAERIEAELRKLEIPCKMVSGRRALLTRLEVRDLANALRALADPSDDYSLLCVLRGPLVSLSLDLLSRLASVSPVSENLEALEIADQEDLARLSKFRRWFEPLSLIGDRLPAAEVLSALFAQPGLLEALATGPQGNRSLANVRRILQMAIAQPELGPLEFADLIQEIQSLNHKMEEAPINELDKDELSIMTIHKSKGLEFPVVVVADTLRKVRGKGSSWVLCHRKGGLAVLGFRTSSPLSYRWLKWSQDEKDVAETQRKMYVAMTRAEDRLILVGSSKRYNEPYIAGEIVRGFGRSRTDWERYAVVKVPESEEDPELNSPPDSEPDE